MIVPGKKRVTEHQPTLPWETIEPADQTIILERQETGALAIADAYLTPPPPPGGNLPTDRMFADGGTPSPSDSKNLSVPKGDAPSSTPATSQRDSGGWTISLLCIGLALIAACVVIPQADANRRLMYERAKLNADLNQIQTQIAVNKEFLQKVQTDPQLLERLAQREMKMVRQGETVLDVKPAPSSSTRDQNAQDSQKTSPFLIVDVPPPAPLPPYKPVGGLFADLCRQPRSQLYIMGAAMLMIAASLVLGSTNTSKT